MQSRNVIVIGIATILHISLVSCHSDTYLGRWFLWRSSDIEDHKRFPSYSFLRSEKPYLFPGNHHEQLDSLKFGNNKKEDLTHILQSSGTTAFLIIKNDTLIYERYFNGYDRSSVNTSFSVAKSITGLLIGAAIDEAIIDSKNDVVTKYIPQLADTDPQYENITIAHLLNMKSGIRFRDHDLPWGDKPKAYYDPMLRDRILRLPVDYAPGAKFKYNSYNPILLGMILESQLDKSVARYFEEKLWNNLGMEYSGSWSMDSKVSGMTKMESGLNLRAIDFAKFGKLVLDKGFFRGKRILSEEWLSEYTTTDKTYRPEGFSEELRYKNLWWMYVGPDEKVNIISGWGHLGQYLFIFPNERIIIVRMGKRTGDIRWKDLFNQISRTL